MESQPLESLKILLPAPLSPTLAPGTAPVGSWFERGVTFGTRKQLQSEQGKAETEQMIAEHEEQKKQREARGWSGMCVCGGHRCPFWMCFAEKNRRRFLVYLVV